MSARGWLTVGLLLWAGRLAAQQTHRCDFCHNLHGAAAEQLRDYQVVETLCLSCHGSAGPAQVDRDGVLVPVPKNVAVHDGPKHTTASGCWECHNHEGEAFGNLVMVQRSVTTPASGVKTVVFTARSGVNSFADADGVYDGVCEVCHTVTTQHNNTGTAGQHNAGAVCTDCHTHQSGFQGAGGCSGCHNTAQDNGDGVPVGGRRAVVGEFVRLAHHVQVPDSVPDVDCQVCHEMSQHQQGRVRLWNVDQPGIVSAAIVLTGNPNTTATEARVLVPFCVACHDADGAGGNTTPFTDGVTVPGLDGSGWASAAHNRVSLGSEVGCYGDGAFGCHATGHGSEKRNMLAPPGAAAVAPALTGEQEGFCYNCHDGTPASTDIQAEFQKGTNTATQIFHHPVAYADQSGSRTVECVSCHAAHVARPDAAAPVAPAASARLLGVSRVSVTNGAAGSTPTFTFRSATDATPAKEYEICLKCHSSYATQPAGQTDLGVVLNPSNPSYHPVEAAGKNPNIRTEAFVNGWGPASTVFCTDCHTSDNTAVRGPHGSVNRYILKKPYTASSSNRTMSSGENCFDCHNFNTYANDQSSNTVKGYSRFNPSTFDKGHTFHVDDRNRPCYACHTTHGSATRPTLIVTGRSPGLNSYTQTGTGGTCNPTCHGSESYTINYAR